MFGPCSINSLGRDMPRKYNLKIIFFSTKSHFFHHFTPQYTALPSILDAFFTRCHFHLPYMANTTLTAASVPLRTNPESWVPLGLHLSNVPQSYPYRCLTAPYGASVTLRPNPDTSVQFA